MLAEPLLVAAQVGECLDGLGVPWLIGGSVASSVHGIPRSTQDLDLVADLRLRHCRPLTSCLSSAFYVDLDVVRQAVRSRSTFNLLHLDTMTKVDVFVLEPQPLAVAELRRRQLLEVQPGLTLPVASPEDIVLQKLAWYRRGGGISQRQWRDVAGVLQVSARSLDRAYLLEMAEQDGLLPLLQQAMAELE